MDEKGIVVPILMADADPDERFMAKQAMLEYRRHDMQQLRRTIWGSAHCESY